MTMEAITKTLLANGSHHNIQHICTKAVVLIPNHCIKYSCLTSGIEEIIRAVWKSLLEMLMEKLHLPSIGAASCLQALAKSEKWKFSPTIQCNASKSTVTAIRNKGGK
eukprot:Gb_02513 [translate_table: standard]